MAKKPIVVDLYAGVGGFSLGFHQAGFEIGLAIDNHQTTVETYQKNFPNTTTSKTNLANSTGMDLLQRASFGAEETDVVIGGPPCQGFSVMGDQNPEDERNDLVPKFADHIKRLDPSYFILENVKGLLSDNVKKYLDEFQRKVHSAGYKIVGPEVLNAANYGVPQKRQRVFILGFKQGNPEPSFPEKQGSTVGAWDAIKDLPDNLENIELDNGIYYGDLGNESEYIKKINSWDPLATEQRDGLSGLDPVDHTQRVRNRFSGVQPGEYDKVSQFRRLKKEKPAPTLRAGSSRERGTHTPARPIHPVAPRCITVREAARLQSFPDWFQFHPTKYHGLRQIGNSVPPLLAEKIAEKVMAIVLESE
jgi:DNA (cytosine-5)-methyltransferase 1